MVTRTEEGTELVQVTLGALVRVEYVEALRVPADLTEDELAVLAGKRYSDVDGGAFAQDPDYWERGECNAVLVDGDSHLKTNGVLTRRADGSLVYAEIVSDECAGQSSTALAAIEDNAAQARSLGLPKLNPYQATSGAVDSDESKAFEAGWYRDFDAWCEEVNEVEKDRCAAINSTPGRLFAAVHQPYPKEMLRLYFDAGHTAQVANDIIVGNHDSGAAEASAS